MIRLIKLLIYEKSYKSINKQCREIFECRINLMHKKTVNCNIPILDTFGYFVLN